MLLIFKYIITISVFGYRVFSSYILIFVEQNPPINDVVQSGVVPRVVKFLSRDDFPKLQVRGTSFSSMIDL